MMLTERSRQTMWAVLGAAAGIVAGMWLWKRQRWGGDTALGGRWSAPTNVAARVATALLADPALSRRSIEVETLSDGVVELSGRVASRDEAGRAVRVAENTAGVFTVVNRLVADDEEDRLEETRSRRDEGEAESGGRHTGMGVGMESRRQSPDTDPDRPSDKQDILDRELDVGTVQDAPEAGPAPVSGAEAVESDPVKPGDEDAIREAGLDPSPRPTSTPKESVESEEEPAAGDVAVEEEDRS